MKMLAHLFSVHTPNLLPNSNFPITRTSDFWTENEELGVLVVLNSIDVILEKALLEQVLGQ